jgi:hypothetical protein
MMVYRSVNKEGSRKGKGSVEKKRSGGRDLDEKDIKRGKGIN